MTQFQAYVEARRLWGNCARALVWQNICRIYRRPAELIGTGASWQEAIKDAQLKTAQRTGH